MHGPMNVKFVVYSTSTKKKVVTFQSCRYNIRADIHVGRKVADPSTAVLFSSSEAGVLLELCDEQRIACSHNNGDDFKGQMFFP